MIEQQIRPWEVLDSRVLGLLEPRAPRRFRARRPAQPGLCRHGTAADQPAVEGQVMLAPRVEARLLQDLAVQPGDKVLEIGTGSGYMAALLARLAQRVVSLEIDEALARAARET
jgi:protein-L-isoaspartate(D-aspartate) O-methyltransferase